MRISRIAAFSFSTFFLLPLALVRPVAARQASPSLEAATKDDPKTAAMKKQIQGYYDEMDRASERLEAAGAFKYYAKDCKFYMRDGKKASMEYLKENWQMIYRRATQAKMQTEITSFTAKNDTATVATHTTAQVQIKGDDGIVRNIDAESHSRDFWMNVKGKWYVKQSRETDRTLKINGQTIEE